MGSDDLFSSFPFLHTKRLTLRQMAVQDAADLHAFYSDMKVTRHLDWLGPDSIEACKMLIESWNEAYAERRLIPWGITLQGSAPIMGTVMLMPTRGEFEVEPRYPLTIGYDLKPDYWNKGMMSEALQAVMDFNDKHIHARRIQAEVHPENIASLHVLKKLGFQQEGVLRQYLMHEATKNFLDVIMLALLFS
ncbi:GNAT family N-acetyltransferase [Paenibacillus sp. FSL H8-0537]|uniref:GNAT family N-acetyltransferase n=1 Tax=Paenibacillus sp. FSL H8-0537 TaxID=2921399 RepID=UPI0031019B02